MEVIVETDDYGLELLGTVALYLTEVVCCTKQNLRERWTMWM
uniref:Phage protein n=1 Tax=Heterorhabditis bacteriophora TaxID=37862 RepID=A0A1I7WL87_HETBA